MSHIPIADVGRRIASVEPGLRDAFDRVLRSGRFILGPEVSSLERAIAARCGVAQGIGVSSGTDALLVAMMALGVGPGDEVVTTPLSFFASVGAILRLGARPVLADVDLASFNLDPAKAAERVTPRTKAIEVVHLFGQCAEVAPLVDAAAGVHAAVIEDAAQALGATRDGRPAGSLGTVGCLSFFPTKNLGCLGDGGMVVTSDEALADRTRMLRAHGAKPKYVHHAVGGNFRLDELQAAMLGVMLPHLDAWNLRRRENADRYDALLADAGLSGQGLVVPPARAPGCTHVFHHYVIRVPRLRDALATHLAGRGIETAVYYPVGFHRQPCLEHLGYRDGDFPMAEQATREVLAIPVYPELTPSQQERVVGEMAGFFATT
jgi:dTDP-4-amino-4,6-dideoxygalactose transaminase